MKSAPIPYDDQGVLLTRDALTVGMDHNQLAALVRGGVLTRIRHGSYCESGRWSRSTPSQRHLITARAAFRTARSESALSHITSVLSHTDGWWDLPLAEVHLTRLDRRIGRREAGICQHQAGHATAYIEPYRDLLRSSAARAALETATLVDFERSLVVINSLLHESKVTLQQLQNELVEMYQFPGTRQHELLLLSCDPRVETVGETRTFCALRGHGLPPLVPQLEILGAGGCLIGRVDFALPTLKVWVEFDGKVKYEKLLRPGEAASDVVVRERNRERQIEATTGWVCVRFVWADLNHPARMVSSIWQAADLAARRASA